MSVLAQYAKRFKEGKPLPPSERKPVDKSDFWWNRNDESQASSQKKPLANKSKFDKLPDTSISVNSSLSLDSGFDLESLIPQGSLDSVTDLDNYTERLIKSCDELISKSLANIMHEKSIEKRNPDVVPHIPPALLSTQIVQDAMKLIQDDDLSDIFNSSRVSLGLSELSPINSVSFEDMPPPPPPLIELPSVPPTSTLEGSASHVDTKTSYCASSNPSTSMDTSASARSIKDIPDYTLEDRRDNELGNEIVNVPVVNVMPVDEVLVAEEMPVNENLVGEVVCSVDEGTASTNICDHSTTSRIVGNNCDGNNSSTEISETEGDVSVLSTMITKPALSDGSDEGYCDSSNNKPVVSTDAYIVDNATVPIIDNDHSIPIIKLSIEPNISQHQSSVSDHDAHAISVEDSAVFYYLSPASTPGGSIDMRVPSPVKHSIQSLNADADTVHSVDRTLVEVSANRSQSVMSSCSAIDADFSVSSPRTEQINHTVEMKQPKVESVKPSIDHTDESSAHVTSTPMVVRVPTTAIESLCLLRERRKALMKK